jgi:hypothetical protein
LIILLVSADVVAEAPCNGRSVPTINVLPLAAAELPPDAAALPVLPLLPPPELLQAAAEVAAMLTATATVTI